MAPYCRRDADLTHLAIDHSAARDTRPDEQGKDLVRGAAAEVMLAGDCDEAVVVAAAVGTTTKMVLSRYSGSASTVATSCLRPASMMAARLVCHVAPVDGRQRWDNRSRALTALQTTVPRERARRFRKFKAGGFLRAPQGRTAQSADRPRLAFPPIDTGPIIVKVFLTNGSLWDYRRFAHPSRARTEPR